MAIQTNLDKRLTDAQVKAGERQEKRQEFIKRKYDAAEQAVKDGTEAPDVVYDFQRQDVYSADPTIDKSYDQANLRSLPIKNYNVMPDGTFGITLDEDSAALELLRQGKFCHNCHDKQPDMPEMWTHIADKLAERIGPRPSWARHGTMCCYCGAKLGLDGDHKESPLVTQITPEQRSLLERMFGNIRADEKE